MRRTNTVSNFQMLQMYACNLEESFSLENKSQDHEVSALFVVHAGELLHSHLLHTKLM